MRRLHSPALSLSTVALLAATSPALAQDSLPPTPPPPPPPPLVAFTGDFGLVNTSGNTDVTTLNVGEEIKINGGRLSLTQAFSVVYGRTDGETTTSLWRGNLHGDLDLTDAVGVFALVAWERNTFAGITRRFEETLGGTFRLLALSGTTLEAQLGLSLIQQQTTVGLDDTFAAGRSMISFKQTFASKSFVQQRVEFLPNLKTSDDYRINSQSSLVAPLSGSIALKVSYVVRFDNQPEPTFEKTDRLLTTGLQITF